MPKDLSIVFLVGSLEPGRDGVGDYTAMLAQSCARSGVLCAIIAVNDRHIEQTIESSISGYSATPTLRLPSKLSWKDRTNLAQKFIQSINPTLLSLQYVAHAYHAKGVAFGITHLLRNIIGHRALHIMFHELWLGAVEVVSYKHKVLGFMQKIALKYLLHRLKPAFSHTSNKFYQECLRQLHLSADLLPLFSNIPIQESIDSDWISEKLTASGAIFPTDKRKDFLIFGTFGTFHREWQPEPLFERLCLSAHQVAKKILFLSIGNLRNSEAHWDSIAEQYRSIVPMIKLGERSPKDISSFLNFIDYGITTSTYALIDKSGSVAAMREHGLSVIVSRYGRLHKKIEGAVLDTSQLIYVDDNFILRIVSGISRVPARSQLSDVTDQFLESIRKL